MRRVLWIVLVVALPLTLTGCLGKKTQVTVPKIDFVMMDGQQCPKLETADMGEDKIISTINTEIEAHFLAAIPRTADGAFRDDVTVHTFVSSTDTVVSILLRSEFDVAYGTDGTVWGICYDYENRMIVPCGAYLSGLGYSYAEVHEKIWKLLSEKSAYENVSILCFFFDSDSNLILVVDALEHPDGADSWSRIYYYSLEENSFVNSPWTTYSNPRN